ncbi:cytochrome Cbb3 oxidase maturation protein CcoH [Polaribacter pacificus]|uniref:Cytochrome Cbb3 oxidase maturation protein CcoH n=1 Tax=Polaribacter pacificus TaxID=1775173 RepID=A0A917HSX1_9FLAO|nr:FixH family protein [Polaribacter pacificus]GGG88979.1 cytochrome Cbb3 oxidase maturation protein CcoH [Polaribacter pacificus]
MKIKMNWGFGVVAAFVLFIGFILYFVISMGTSKNLEYDLVSKDYYKDELKFQDQINANKNSKNLKQDLTILKTKEGLKIMFPKEMETKKIEGKVFLYRPSNKQLDFETPIVVSDSSYLLMPDKRLLGGRWNITVSWSYKDQKYLFKKELFY